MYRVKTNKEFIEEAVAVHGDVYDYSLTCYVKSKEEVIINCKIHGNYKITPNSHLAGQCCKACGVELRASKQRGNNELFLTKAREKHGDKYDYSKVEYFNSLTKIEIVCEKHGSFFQTPKIHYRANCPDCGRDAQIEKASKTPETFIEQATKKYGDKYDYSLVEYVNNKVPVTVICSERGLMEVRPDLFLTNRVYIQQGRKKTKSTDKEMFLEEVYKVYGDKNDYANTEVGNSRGKIKVVCKEHGEFEVYMTNHFQGQDCPKCSAINYSNVRRKTTEEFVKEAKEIHGDSCDYTETVYKTCKDKVRIKCNIHNTFFKTLPSNHIIGSKCKECHSEKISKALTGKEGTCGYNRSAYVEQADGREACVYLIRCYDENNEEFYKIGKTFLKINKRFTKSNLFYSFQVIHFHFGEAGYIYDLENELHRKYKEFKYRPSKWFAGHTECYKMNLPIQEIKDL